MIYVTQFVEWIAARWRATLHSRTIASMKMLASWSVTLVQNILIRIRNIHIHILNRHVLCVSPGYELELLLHGKYALTVTIFFVAQSVFVLVQPTAKYPGVHAQHE